METILNYLDNMFMNMPQTPEVIKAKKNLSEMMEDKYNELISEGKRENEAVGIVISEFGNLDELASELGIENVMHNMNDDMYESGRNVSLEVVKEYVEKAKKASFRIGIGVMLCILSPVTMILLVGMAESGVISISSNFASGIGLFPLAILVAIAVGIFIFNGMRMEKYDYLKKEKLSVDVAAMSYVNELEDSTRVSFALHIVVGVVMCIIAGFQVAIVSCFSREIAGKDKEDFIVLLSVSILLVIVSIAVFIFITAGSVKECVKVIRQEDDYTVGKKSGENKLIDIISGIYWPVATVIYLAWSFLSRDWGITWIVWPIAGILFGAICTVISAVQKGQKN